MPPEDHSNNGWPEYKQRVLFQLEELTRKMDKLDDKVTALHTDLTVLKTKAGIWGSVAGFLVSLAVSILMKLVLK